MKTPWLLLLVLAASAVALPATPREDRRAAQRRAVWEERHPYRPLLERQDPRALLAERQRLEREVAALRHRLEEAGYSEAGRKRPTWWDLPSRREQAMRLRKLRRLRFELDQRLERLEDLREMQCPPASALH